MSPIKIHKVAFRREYPVSDGKGGTKPHSYVGKADVILVEDLKHLPITATVGRST